MQPKARKLTKGIGAARKTSRLPNEQARKKGTKEMTHTKDTNEPNPASKFAPAPIIGSEDVERFKRRAEKLGLIIHKQFQRQKHVEEGKK